MALPLEQITILEAMPVTVGLGITPTAMETVREPQELVPTTVYVVVMPGLNVLGEPVPQPGQKYVVPPEAINIILFPLQIVGLLLTREGLLVTVIVGALSTVTKTVFLLTHPVAV